MTSFKKKKKQAVMKKRAVSICSGRMGLSLLALLIKDPAGLEMGDIVT